MSTPVIPPPPPPVQSAPLPPLSNIATVAKPPPALIQAQLNTMFEATVTMGGDGKGAVEVASKFGDFRLQSAIAFAKGAKLGLQLQGFEPKLTLAITSLNGKAIPQAAQWSRIPQQQTPQTLTDTVQTGQLSGGLPRGAPILATVLRGAPLTGQPSQSLLPGAYGQGTLGAKAQTATTGAQRPGTTTPTAAQGVQAGAQTTPTLPQMQTALNGLLGGDAKPLPPGMQFQIRIVTVHQPSGSSANAGTTATPTAAATATPNVASATAQPTAASTVPTTPNLPPPPFQTTGTVVGAMPQGQTLLQTDSGLLALETKTPLSMGARVTVQIDAQQIIQRELQSAEGRGGTTHWTALREAVEVLQEANPALARQVISASIPRPDAALGNTMIFFLTALRVGTMRNLLGESAFRVLEKGRPNLLGKIGDEFKSGGQRVSDPVTGDWRVAFVPLMQDQHMGDIRIALREQDKGGKSPGDDEGEGTRFIVDVQVERFGRIQFDGLAKSKKKRFDLIIRTTEAMPAEVRKDINGIFTSTCEAHSLSAQLLFQVTPKFVEMGGIEMDKDALGMIV
jgi:hypothetical protein